MTTSINQPKLIRRRQLRDLTGWNDKYISKLIASGVLRTWRPPGSNSRTQAWFYRSQVEELTK